MHADGFSAALRRWKPSRCRQSSVTHGGIRSFRLSLTENAEATAAIRKCGSAGITLDAALDYANRRMNLAERSRTLKKWQST